MYITLIYLIILVISIYNNNLFILFAPIFIIIGILGLILVDLPYNKVKNIILHNKFLSYKLLEINNNYIYLIKFISLILHLILILIPLYYINKYKYYNKINIYKSLLISLLILLAYSILIYPKSITSIYLLY